LEAPFLEGFEKGGAFVGEWRGEKEGINAESHMEIFGTG
jgi:hypothetical protein